MKKYCLLICSIVFINCSNNDSNRLISLPEVELFLEVYNVNNQFIFINDIMDTLVVRSTYEKRIANRELPNGNSFMIDDYLISLYSDTTELDMVILGGAFTSTDLKTIIPSINIKLMPFTTNSIWMDIKLEDMAVNSTFTTKFASQIALNNKTFNDVYSVFNENSNSYSEFHFNREYGVLAFKDSNDIFWRIDKSM